MGQREPSGFPSTLQDLDATTEVAAKAVRADLQNQKLLHTLCTKLTGLKTSLESEARLTGGSGLWDIPGNTSVNRTLPEACS